MKTFEVSRDPEFVGELEGIAEPYLNPLDHALVPCCDEKSQVQAAGPRPAGAPMKKERAGTMAHDYKRHGTTALFAALSAVDGQVIGQRQKRRHHTEWLAFLRQIDRKTPRDKGLRFVCDTITHKHPEVRAWLGAHPRFHMHLAPTSASWLNRVERFFRDITTERLRRGVFRSILELTTVIEKCVAAHNSNAKAFTWTTKTGDFLQKVIRANRRLTSKQNGALH